MKIGIIEPDWQTLHVRAICKQARLEGAPFAWIELNGHEAAIPVANLGDAWIEKATMDDFRRVAVQ